MDPDHDFDSAAKQAILNTLLSVLSSSELKRKDAEAQLKALEVVEDYGMHLTAIALDEHSGLNPGIRQLASVLLHQYVDAHWSSASDKFVKPEASEKVKRYLRAALPKGLSDSSSKVRTSVAYAIASIAVWDFPNQWPDLASILVDYSNASAAFVQGSMQVLEDMAGNVGDDAEMNEFAPIVLPHLYQVFADKEKFSTENRLRAVSAFMLSVSRIVSLAESDRDMAKSFLYPVIPSFSAAMVTALRQPGDLELRTKILNCLGVLFKKCPKLMSHYAVEVLSPVWDALIHCAEYYCQSGTKGEDVEALEDFIFAVFNFVTVLVASRRFRGSVLSSLPDLMYYVFKYMEMTEEQMAEWSSEVGKFIEDEDEECMTYSVRIAAQCLLLDLFDELGKGCREALFFGMRRHLDDAARMKASDPHGNWWKKHESAYLAVGVVHEHIANEESSHFLRELVENYVLPDLSLRMFPFLHGRCLWLTSRLGKILPPEIVRTCLAALVEGIGVQNPTVIRACAASALYGFTQCRSVAEDFRRCLPVVVGNLVELASTNDPQTVTMVLEHLPHCLSVDEGFTAQVEPKITSLALDVFAKRNNDPVVASLCEELFSLLAKNPHCSASLEAKLVPSFVGVLLDDGSRDGNVSGLKKVMLEVLKGIVRNSSVPLSNRLMNEVFPAVVEAVLKHDDEVAAMVAGCECLRAFVSVSPAQVIDWKYPGSEDPPSSSSVSGLDRLVGVASHLLNLKTAESSGRMVGRLLTVMFTKCGPRLANTHVDHLLKAVLSKMQQCQTQTVMQTLLMVYAYVMYHQLELGLEFLSSVPGPTGKSALHYVLNAWCARHALFVGSYETKVSTAGLLRVFDHGIRMEDKRLTSIMYEDDEGPDVPILLKIFRVLAEQLALCPKTRFLKENPGSSTANAFLSEFAESQWEDDDEDEDDDEEDLQSPSKAHSDSQGFLTLDQVLSNDASRKLGWSAMNDGEYESDDESHDPDVVADPLNALHLEQVLAQQFRELSRFACFPSFLLALEPTTRKTLEEYVKS